jgi:RNA polymerase sigma-70 factor (ECF subfamily)
MSMQSYGLDALWSRARSGDGQAFGEVFDACHDRVYRHALRLVRDSHDAEDVTAIAFLELWRRRDDVRVVSGSVLPWLLVTATNVSRNQRRSAARYRRFLATLPKGEVSSLSAAEASDSLDLELAVLAALKELRGDDLHLVVLVSIEDYTLVDAAAVLGISECAAKSRMHRIRSKIRNTVPHLTTAEEPGWSTPR